MYRKWFLTRNAQKYFGAATYLRTIFQIRGFLCLPGRWVTKSGDVAAEILQCDSKIIVSFSPSTFNTRAPNPIERHSFKRFDHTLNPEQ